MMRQALVAELTDVVVATGFQNHLAQILDEAVECIYVQASAEKQHRIGDSRLGGTADLPANVNWPVVGGQEAFPKFLAQFRLGDIPAIDGMPKLGNGMLWLFVPNGNGIEFQMPTILDDEPRNLETRLGPSFVEDSKSVSLSFRVGASLPFYKETFTWAIGSGEIGEQVFTPEDLASRLAGENSIGQIGGYSHEWEYDLYRRQAFRELGRMDCYRRYPRDDGKDLPGDEVSETPGRIEMRQWYNLHLDEIAKITSQWRMFLRFRQFGIVEFLPLGSATALEIFIKDSAFKRLDVRDVWGEMPQVL